MIFQINQKKLLWHYVALCGAIFLFEKIEKISFFQKNRCGAMWRYVALYIFLKKMKKSVFFQKNRCGAMWRYVALCGAIYF